MRPYFAALPVLALCAVCIAGCWQGKGQNVPDPQQPVNISDGAPAAPDAWYVKGQLYTELKQHTYSQIGTDMNPRLTPDGKGLLYASTHQTANYNLFLKDVEGRAVTQLTNNTWNTIMPAISPDGRHIAFCADKEGNFDLFLAAMPLGSSSIAQPLTVERTDELHPSWSPDGKRLAYCRYNPINLEWEVHVYDLAKKQSTCLGTGFLPEWSPVDDVIAFQMPRKRGEFWYGIWTIRSDGNMMTEIVADVRWAAINPAWSPDGKRIAFATVLKSPDSQKENRVFEGDDIWIVNSDGGMPVQLTTHPAPDWNPFWGKDGRIYFCSRYNGLNNIWSVKPVFPDMDLGGVPGAEPGVSVPADQPPANK
jgi:TolB protein